MTALDVPGSDGNGLAGRVALITGAGRNLGRVTALRLARSGVRVGVNVHTRLAEGEETVRLIKEAGRDAILLPGDIAEEADVTRMVDILAETYGRIDILINNAAFRPLNPMLQITVEEWDRVMAVNLRGPFLTVQKVVPHMMANGFGRIVNIGSIIALWGTPNRAHSVAAKAALLGFTRALASELVDAGITVNVVVPGPLDGEKPARKDPNPSERQANRLSRVLMRRLGRRDEVANVIHFLVSDESSFVTGQDIHVNGGAYPTNRGTDSEHGTLAAWKARQSDNKEG